MSLAKRLIPCLDVDNGRVVKGVNFINIIDAGDPKEIAKRYDEEGADELVMLDITASNELRETTYKTIEEIASEVFIPLTVGGGVRTLEDIKKRKELGDLALIKQSRLSVMPIDYKSWKIINNMSRI